MSMPAPRYVCRTHVDCNLDTDQPALFEAHVKAKGHGCHRIAVPRLPKRLWSGPRLNDEGRPFEPTGLEPGAAVTWRQLVPTGESFFDDELGRVCLVQEWIERAGQVWSNAHRGAWVIPDDEIGDEAELAVLVRKVGDRLEEWGTFRGTAKRAVA